MGGTSAADAALATLRGDVINIVLETFFLTVGATACAMAMMRGRRGVRILAWWGIFSGSTASKTLGQTSSCTNLGTDVYARRSLSQNSNLSAN